MYTKKTTDLPNLTSVNAYFYYMWNRFSKEECIAIWGKIMGEHFFKKWCGMNNDFLASSERLWADLSNNNRQLLLNRAWKYYTK